jgi:hypothetical protein
LGGAGTAPGGRSRRHPPGWLRRNFLLAWWNAGDLGGFDLTEAWGLDEALREDLVTLFGFIARNKVYPSAFSFRFEFDVLARQWRPQVLSDET